MYKPLFAGAVALTCFAAFGSNAAIAHETAQDISAEATPTAEQLMIVQRDPRDPVRRDDDSTIIEEGGVEDLEEEVVDDGNGVTFAVRLNTELFVNSGDLVEFLVPIRYSPSDRLAMEAVPVIKYFPESTDEEFDYGIKFAIEYQL